MRYNLFLAAAMLAAGPAAQAAENDALFIGGAEVSGHGSRYAQAGALAPLPGSALGDGYVMRGLVNGLTYEYRGAPGRVEATGAGAEFALGYQQSGTPGWWAFYTGPVYRYTRLSPKDSRSDAAGSKAGWLVQGEGERKVAEDFKVNFSGNYVFSGNRSFWTRLRLLYRVDGPLFTGPEGIWQGDADYKAWQAGLGLFGIPLSEEAELGIKAGVRKTERLSVSPYGGFEIGYSF